MKNISIPSMPLLIQQAAEGLHRFASADKTHELRGMTMDQIYQSLVHNDVQLSIDPSANGMYVQYKSSLAAGGFLIEDPSVAMTLQQYIDQKSSGSPDSSVSSESSL